ncbi:ribonuclease HI-like protein, partial [Trifolium pratense]
VQRFSQGLGTQTNNSAEYQGLLLGLKEARNQGYDCVHVQGDSKLVCKQFEGSWKVNNQNLRGLCSEAQQLRDNFKSVTVEHVPRVFTFSSGSGLFCLLTQ